MDRNTELLLQKAERFTRWEDEEKATNDVGELREEFRRRLYGSGDTVGAAEPTDGPAGSGARRQGPRQER